MPARFIPVSHWTSRVELCPTISGWYTKDEYTCEEQDQFGLLSGSIDGKNLPLRALTVHFEYISDVTGHSDS